MVAENVPIRCHIERRCRTISARAFTGAVAMCGNAYMDVVKGPSALSSIKFLTGPLAGRSYQITKPVTSIGREQNNDSAKQRDQG